MESPGTGVGLADGGGWLADSVLALAGAAGQGAAGLLIQEGFGNFDVEGGGNLDVLTIAIYHCHLAA